MAIPMTAGGRVSVEAHRRLSARCLSAGHFVTLTLKRGICKTANIVSASSRSASKLLTYLSRRNLSLKHVTFKEVATFQTAKKAT